MEKVLVIAQITQNHLSPAVNACVTAALAVSKEVDMLLATQDETLHEAAQSIEGVQKIFCATDPRFAHPLAEDLSALIATVAKNYTHIFAPATTFGKNLMPRLAACLDSSCLTDVTQVLSPNTFVRPIYAGNAFETIETSDTPVVASIRPTAFEAQPTKSTKTPIENISVDQPAFEKSRFVRADAPVSERPDLTAAKIVVSGGRAFKNAENFKLLEQLADQLGAAVGATRAAVDAGFAPNDLQVGQTGKVVAPDLYFAFGISGAIQHIAGIKDSKVIVAINQDPDAPIFEVADYGLVGDIFTVLPELAKALAK